MSETLNIYTAAFPTITTNQLKYVVYKSSEYPAEVASQTFNAPHGERTVTFSGLENVMHIWKLLEMNGTSIVKQWASFDVRPKTGGNGVEYKAPVEIQVDITVGVTNDTTSFVMDGTDGKMDWRGWNIWVERVGQGTMKQNTQFTWDANSGTFTLINDGDTFQPYELFVVQFETVVLDPGETTTSKKLFDDILVIDSAIVLTADDVKKKLIIKGTSDAFDVELPDIETVPSYTPIYIESGIGDHINVRIKCHAGNTIDWMKGSRTDLKIGVCESLILYRELLDPVDPTNTQWRVHDGKGNFLTVGQHVSSDADESEMYNAILFDGRQLNSTIYTRLYEDHVQKLDPSQVCNYADHETGDNIYKFSYADPTTKMFYIPNRLNLFERNSNGTNKPGDYKLDAIIDFRAKIPRGDSYSGNGQQAAGRVGGGQGTNLQTDALTISGGLVKADGVTPLNTDTETYPKHYVTRKFLLI